MIEIATTASPGRANKSSRLPTTMSKVRLTVRAAKFNRAGATSMRASPAISLTEERHVISSKYLGTIEIATWSFND